MARQAWLESSLQRSASLGREVLERASRRSIDWTSSGASQTPTTPDKHGLIHVKRANTELDVAFATISDFMAQTTYQCKRFYGSDCCTKLTDTERNHSSRFHTRPSAEKKTSALLTQIHVNVSGKGKDYYIEVSPGTYAITVSTEESRQQQTRLVSVRAGESISTTFNL
ncbi:A-kinase-interacting protein 1 [Solea solea]|uniref:A-kinase-interacting protein 1 n=1 Tax=Solea solea TaxID=90069 RepID=UPI00272B0411|nr:A-kinase-interacting protein 1 [Solea solea]